MRSKQYRKLGRKTGHYWALSRALINSLFQYERIVTTEAKAKEFRSQSERLITLAKTNSLHHFRMVLSFLQNETIAKKLFNEIAPRFKDRPGGYTRIIKLGGCRWLEKGKSKWVSNRLGDNAPRVIFELVVKEEKVDTAKAKKKGVKSVKAEKPVKKTKSEKPAKPKTSKTDK